MTIEYLGEFEIVSFYELTEDQQQEEIDWDKETAEQASYMKNKYLTIRLDNFMRGGPDGFDAHITTSNYGGYLLTLNDSGDGGKLYASY